MATRQKPPGRGSACVASTSMPREPIQRPSMSGWMKASNTLSRGARMKRVICSVNLSGVFMVISSCGGR